MFSSNGRPQKITLFVCSSCLACERVETFLQGWAQSRADAGLEVITIEARPSDFVRWGISHTPAIILEKELVVQNVTIEMLAEYLPAPQSSPLS